MESLEGGFLFVVEDLAAFEKVRDRAELARKLLEIETKKPEFSLEFEDVMEKIAAQGEIIKFYVEGKSSDSDIIFAILKDNFDQVSKAIKVVPIDFNEIQIQFKDLEAFKLYARICMSFTQDLKQNAT